MSDNTIKIRGISGKGNTALYIATGIVYIICVTTTYIFPYRLEKYLLFSIPVGVASFVSAIWYILRPNVYIKHFLQISASSLLALIAYRSISFLFPYFFPFTETLMILGLVFVHTLPFWNLPVATLIGDELYIPKTRIGRFVFKIIFFISPIAAISGTILGKLPQHSATVLIVGIICVYLAYSVPFPGLSHYSKKSRKTN